MTKAFVAPTGVYLGSFDGDVPAPDGALVVDSAPADARQVWDFDRAVWLPAPAVVPTLVTPRQIRLALLQLGLLPAAATWIEATDEATRIEWNFAIELRRDHPMWSAAATALGKTEADIDNLFALAATL